jgi:hypothetical protein
VSGPCGHIHNRVLVEHAYTESKAFCQTNGQVVCYLMDPI